MATIAHVVDEQIRELEQAAERHLAAGGSAVKGAAAERDLLAAAEGARDFLARAVRGERGTLIELFGHNCQRWERLRDLIDRVSLSDAADKRWQSLRDVVETTECILKQLGTFKGLFGPRGSWPTLGRGQPTEARAVPVQVALGGEGGERKPEEAELQLPCALTAQPGAITLLLHEGVSVEEATWRVRSDESGEAKAELVFSMRERRTQAQGDHGHRPSTLNFGLELPEQQQEASLAVPRVVADPAPEDVPERAIEACEEASTGASTEASTEAEALVAASAEPSDASPESIQRAVAEVAAEEPAEAATEAALEEAAEEAPASSEAAGEAMVGQLAAEQEEVVAGRAAEEESEAGIENPGDLRAGLATPDCSPAGIEHPDDLGFGLITPDCSPVCSRHLSAAWRNTHESLESEQEDEDSLLMSTLDIGAVALGVRDRGQPAEEAVAQPVEAPPLPPPVSVVQQHQNATVERHCLVADIAAESVPESTQRPAAPQKQRLSVEVPVELVARAAARPLPHGASRSTAASLATAAHPPLPRHASASAALRQAQGTATPALPGSSTLPWDPSVRVVHRSASTASPAYPSLSTFPRHCSPAGVAVGRRASMSSLVVPASRPPSAAGGAPPCSTPVTPPMVHRTFSDRPSQRMPVQRMESAPSSALRGVMRREAGHWEERRVVEVRTERLWVPHKREEVEL